jgi:GNAT superfamily N-acetyltransferase
MVDAMSSPLGCAIWRVRAAHGDAWQVEGRLREPFGGGAAECPGVRLMASGLPDAAWNNADVTNPGAVDVDAVRAWYAGRSVPWGLCLPAGAHWPHGRRLFVKRCMGLGPNRFAAATSHPDVEIGPAGRAHSEIVAAIDSAAFEAEPAASAAWIGPQLSSPAHVVALARLADEPVGIAVSVRSDDSAGPALGIFGVGVVPRARRRGVGAALVSWLVERGFAAGAELAHLNPNTDEAARIYARLGFVETAGLDVYVDVQAGSSRT